MSGWSTSATQSLFTEWQTPEKMAWAPITSGEQEVRPASMAFPEGDGVAGMQLPQDRSFLSQ